MNHLRKKLCIFTTTVIIASLIPGFAMQPAQADALTNAIKITDEIPPQPVGDRYGQVFFDQTYSVIYSSGRAVLSSTPDGQSGGVVDDVLLVTVTHPDGATSDASFDYSNGCSGLAVRPPWDIAALLVPGNNQMRIRFRDQCGGSIGAWPMYFVSDTPPPVPVVASIVPDPAKPTDTLLTRGVSITPVDNGVAADHYEYGWAPAGTGVTAPTKQTQTSHATHATLNFGVASPDSDWLLFARGVTTAGQAGPWSPPTLVHTPPAPVLIALGDSISSGHHNDYGDDYKTTCKDANYGYMSDFAQRWFGALPPQWRTADQYNNIAFSGFATARHAGVPPTTGTVLDGGQDACHKTSPGEAPIKQAQALLASHHGSWNRVAITAGINDTNWGWTIQVIVTLNTLYELRLQGSLPSLICTGTLGATWNGNQAAVTQGITSGTKEIVGDLRQSDSAVKITWLSYYNTAGTATNHVHVTPYVPSTCTAAFDGALATVHAAIKAGLPSDVTFVDIDQAMRSKDDRMQPLFLLQQLTSGTPNPSGWPHPNRVGATAIANAMDPQWPQGS